MPVTLASLRPRVSLFAFRAQASRSGARFSAASIAVLSTRTAIGGAHQRRHCTFAGRACSRFADFVKHLRERQILALFPGALSSAAPRETSGDASRNIFSSALGKNHSTNCRAPSITTPAACTRALLLCDKDSSHRSDGGQGARPLALPLACEFLR